MGLRIFGIIIIVIAVLLAIAFSVAYVRIVKRSIAKEGFNKQKYVKKNRTRFGVNNKGTSMDCCKIFTISTSDLGLQ